MIPTSRQMMITMRKVSPQDDNLFHRDLSLNNNLSTSEKENDPVVKNLQPQIFHETYPSVTQNSLNTHF